METTDSAYPVRFEIDYPEEPRNRLTAAFRLILAIPILAVIGAIDVAGSSSSDATLFICIAAGVLFLPSLMLIVARQKYPRWWFDFSVAYLGSTTGWPPTSCSSVTSTRPPTKNRPCTCRCRIPTSTAT